MKHVFLVVAVIIGAAGCLVTRAAQEPASRQTHAETIRRMLKELHAHGEFTGSVLVADDGVVLYRDAIASTPDEARKLLRGPANIGSVAKPFTAMAVMMLAEQRKLAYDDPIGRYVTELAAAPPDITIRHLLTHTSGIPDVGDLGIDRPGLSESDIVSAVRNNHAQFARPGARYRYSNTGYMLLGMAVENASGRTFDEFLQTRIFTPLDMRNTRPESGPRRPDATKGHGGLVSTVDDLLKWDRGIASNRLVRAETLTQALVPAKVADGESRYAFGWNVEQKDGDTFMWHQGNAGGRQRAFLGRRLRDDLTIIILTKENSRRLEIADAIVNIAHGRPYDPPKLSIARKLLSAIDAQGLDAALSLYDQLRKTAGKRYDFSEGELNSLGYTLLDRGKSEDAVRVFELNIRQFPASSNVFDSLGEAFYRSGRRAEAAKAYSHAIALDPSNVNARAMLLKLKEQHRH